MRETWYKLESGRIVDPAEVFTREDGRLVHVGGDLVAMRGDIPYSWSVDPDEERAKAKDAKPDVTREMDADKPKRAYTRRSKGD